MTDAGIVDLNMLADIIGAAPALSPLRAEDQPAIDVEPSSELDPLAEGRA